MTSQKVDKIKKGLIFFSLFICGFFISVYASESETIDLSGQWYYRLHSAPSEIPGEGELQLPGTLDTNRRGKYVVPGNHTSQLSRIFTFTGKVSYYKTIYIPDNWGNKTIELFIERTRPSTLIFDGDTLGKIGYLSSPHIYELPTPLQPGIHELEIIVDNGDAIPPSIRNNSHSATEYTQTNWNGMIGEIRLQLKEGDNKALSKKTVNFPRLYREGNRFMADGHQVFLRGTVDACVFPKTGHPPMDKDTWIDYLQTLKSYGFNHVRFHTWCPPDAAFQAADELGIYLQIELPVWGELDRDLKQKRDFLWNEMEGILDAYSHHPSFSLFSVGNELWGDISLMKEFTDKVKEKNSGILVTYASNLYSGMYGYQEGEEFMVASRSGRDDNRATDLRGSFSFADSPDGGILNSTVPSTSFNYDKATFGLPVPVISHEVGQYQSYPDYTEIDEYSGVLRPDNLEEFKRRSEEAGTFPRSDIFNYASSKWASKLYKAEIEALLRSKDIDGFQLMSVQDYPGQGTALVGMFNSFMEPKKGFSRDEWISSCNDVTFLAEFPKFTFESGEIVNIPVKYINYSAKKDTVRTVEWDTSFAKGIFPLRQVGGLTDAGTVNLKMPLIDKPKKFTFSLTGNDGETKNFYDFWVYPPVKDSDESVFMTKDMDTALQWLSEGKKVLLTPDLSLVEDASIPPQFVNDFWNYRMYRTICDHMEVTPPPGTLGLSMDNTHKAFGKFPTDNHTDWQWYNIIMNSRPLIVDRLPKDFVPIIEVIDNTERNFRLAMMLECSVGKGKLMILSADADKLSACPEGRWLLYSVSEYMASKAFKPKLDLDPSQVTNLLTKPSNNRLIRELKNEIYDSHWD